MAKAFGKAKGAAQKNKLPNFRYTDGTNRVRLVGELLPRYVYWIKGENNKDIPFECLGFDREAEAFTNLEKDWVREFLPELKCSWSYCIQGITDDGELVLVNLKKKLFEQIQVAMEELGDPTDPETGWPIVFERKKTGPHNYNVEYTLKVLTCSKEAGPLTEEQKAIAEQAKPMDEVLPRPTPDAQKALLDRIFNGKEEAEPENEDMKGMDDEIGDEFSTTAGGSEDFDDDIPF